MMPSASTRLFAVLGDPVAHSLSPVMHNAAFRAAGLDATFVALRVEASRVLDAMQMLASSGGGGNVTIPHKAVAARAAADGSPEAMLGAVNTFWGGGDGLRVANTDVDGVAWCASHLGAGAGGHWLVIGTGGSARAVIAAAARAGASIAIRSRDMARADSLGKWAATIGCELAAGDPTLVVNATPLGLDATDPLPIAPSTCPELCAALDLVYRPDGATPWIRAWRAAGRDALDGRSMLVAQGAAAWRHWFPGVAVPVEVMRAAVRGDLG